MAFSGNINSNNFVILGDPNLLQRIFYPCIFTPISLRVNTDRLIGSPDSGGTPGGPQSHPTEPHALTQPEVSILPQSANPGASNAAGDPRFFETMYSDPADYTPRLALGGMEAHAAPVRRPPPWKLKRKIGSGSFGVVFLEKAQMSGMEAPELIAVKRISRTVPNFPAKKYKSEIKNFKILSNYPWFVKFNSSYEDDHFVYIAMEYIAMGDMSTTFADNYQWNEGDTKVVIQQLLHGLVAMHKEGITHRDLKPANIFLCLPEDQPFVLRVKIADFGTSKRIPSDSSSTCMKTIAGTQDFMAPEMDDTDVDKTNAVDIWSLGCISYRMIAGSPPFSNRHKVVKYASTPPEAVKNGNFSDTCKDFLRDVLHPRPEERPSAEVCLTTAWITSEAPGPEYSIGRDLYNRLLKIKLAAPGINTLSDAAPHPAVGRTPVRGFSTGAMPVTHPTASRVRSATGF